MTPYFTLIPKIKKALRKAAKRGVKVEVMISERSDIPLTPDCVFYNAHKMMKHGVDVWVYRPGFHHTKIIMVDGKFCTVGSANLDARSMRFDYEENAVIVDPCTTRQLNDMFERDKKRAFCSRPNTGKRSVPAGRSSADGSPICLRRGCKHTRFKRSRTHNET